MENLPRRLSLLLVCAFFVAACGGGGGSSPPAAPPPIAVPNTPPVVSFTISSDTFDEGETFLIDASTSYDPDGEVRSIVAEHDIEPYYPEQVANQVNIGSHPKGVFEFLVPDVFADTQAKFDIIVEDNDGAISWVNAWLNFKNTVNIPKIDGFGEAYRVIDAGRSLRLLGNGIDDIFAVETGNSTDPDDNRIVAVTGVYEFVSLNTLQTDSSVLGGAQSADALVPDGLGFNLSPTTPIQLTVISEAGNAVHWFADYEVGHPHEYELKESIDIERPCHFQAREDTGQDYVWIGQRGAGLSVVQIAPSVPSDLPPGTPNSNYSRGFDYSIKSRAGGNRSLCHIYPTILSERLSNQFPQSTLTDLIAVDYDSNELVLFADDEGNDGIYEVVDVVPLATDGAQGLNVIDVFGVGAPHFFPNFLLILMSDGIHDGQHRLIIVDQELPSRELSQSVYAWQGGVPIKMIAPGNLFGTEGKSDDYGVDLVIITSTSDEAVILEDERADIPLGLGPPVYKPAQYLNIGFGAGSAIAIQTRVQGSYPRPGLMVAFPESNELKLWVYRD